MLSHQATYIDHLIELIRTERIDLVVLAGDVYDRALPPVDAVALADDAFGRLAASRAHSVITSGNHDSAQRLGFASRLIDSAGVFIRADATAVGRPIELSDAHGPIAVYPVPYLDPESVREPWGLPVRSHEAALSEAMSRVHTDLGSRPGTRSIVVAHAFVAGAAPSESERDISVGGVSIVPTATFHGCDYVALGHLHGRQTLTESIRYSGSPLAYSFSEADHLKGSWLIDLGATGVASAEFIAAPVPRPLARIRGELAHVLADPGLTQHETSWVQVTLTDPVRQAGAMDALRRRFAHTLVLNFEASEPTTPHPRAISAVKSDHDITLDFVASIRGQAASPAESALLQAACDGCTEDSDLDYSVPVGIG